MPNPKNLSVLEIPAVGSLWRHYKGGLYTVVAIAKLESNPTAGDQVVYSSVETKETWVRPLSEWHELLDGPVAGTVSRFKRVPDHTQVE